MVMGAHYMCNHVICTYSPWQESREDRSAAVQPAGGGHHGERAVVGIGRRTGVKGVRGSCREWVVGAGGLVWVLEG